MTLLASALVLSAVAAGGYGLRWILNHVSSMAIRQRAILLALSVLPIPAWFLAFPNQVAMHAWFMDRIIGGKPPPSSPVFLPERAYTGFPSRRTWDSRAAADANDRLLRRQMFTFRPTLTKPRCSCSRTRMTKLPLRLFFPG
jgi:hypothetical protein